MKTLLISAILVASSQTYALGAAGVALSAASRGGVHRHCDDACRYRLDQAHEALMSDKTSKAYKSSPEGRREKEVEREEQQRKQGLYKQRPEYSKD